MKTKCKGSRVERELFFILQNSGYNVIKSGGSFGLFDLVAFNKGHILLIQVKANKISSQETETIARFTNHPDNAYKLIAVKRDYNGWDIFGVTNSNGVITKYNPTFLDFVRKIK